jgi:Domain of unknown function (DUF4169)
MADVINLRTARKQAARRQKEARAAQNRVIHGRSKAERALDEARSRKAHQDLEAHRTDGEDR